MTPIRLMAGVCLSLAASCSMQSSPQESAAIFDCGSTDEAPVSNVVQGLTHIRVYPKTVASCIEIANEPHEIYLPQFESKGVLAVFLPGTDGLASDYPWLLHQGGKRGYHVIGLNYPNPVSINVLCNDLRGDSGCFSNARHEIITGEDQSDLVSVDIPSSIEGRLLALLTYLALHRPADGWDQYLVAGSVTWEKVHLAGHSQGSGHAAFQGKRKALARVVLFSGVSDYSLALANTPDWMRLASTTEPSRHYGFIHEDDALANFSKDPDQVVNAWQSDLGLEGELVSVDQGPGTPPYQQSHQLSTAACKSYSELVKHMCPVSNGYQNVWNYLLYP